MILNFIILNKYNMKEENHSKKPYRFYIISNYLHRKKLKIR